MNNIPRTLAIFKKKSNRFQKCIVYNHKSNNDTNTSGRYAWPCLLKTGAGRNG